MSIFSIIWRSFRAHLAPGLTSVHAAGETALDTASIETITGLKGVSNQAEGNFKISKPRNEKSSIDGAVVSQVFGQKGDANSGMYSLVPVAEILPWGETPLVSSSNCYLT